MKIAPHIHFKNLKDLRVGQYVFLRHTDKKYKIKSISNGCIEIYLNNRYQKLHYCCFEVS